MVGENSSLLKMKWHHERRMALTWEFTKQTSVTRQVLIYTKFIVGFSKPGDIVQMLHDDFPNAYRSLQFTR